ncbi:hypothetical protein R3P38DRAFT_3194947 [Favolaschia claudopus]|uniref:Uncharacterized protein n=1 Tax=Favolaschia claudopus TaxID=2862362 RepID=A0AAW0BA53_9AGAR
MDDDQPQFPRSLALFRLRHSSTLGNLLVCTAHSAQSWPHGLTAPATYRSAFSSSPTLPLRRLLHLAHLRLSFCLQAGATLAAAPPYFPTAATTMRRSCTLGPPHKTVFDNFSVQAKYADLFRQNGASLCSSLQRRLAFLESMTFLFALLPTVHWPTVDNVSFDQPPVPLPSLTLTSHISGSFHKRLHFAPSVLHTFDCICYRLPTPALSRAPLLLCRASCHASPPYRISSSSPL